MKRVGGALVLAWAFLTGPTPLLWAQCAMCKTLLTNSPEGRAMSGRFNIAILLMLIAPYLVATSVLLALFRDRIQQTAASLLRRRTRTHPSPV